MDEKELETKIQEYLLSMGCHDIEKIELSVAEIKPPIYVAEVRVIGETRVFHASTWIELYKQIEEFYYMKFFRDLQNKFLKNKFFKFSNLYSK